jgi:hypothetical protein
MCLYLTLMHFFLNFYPQSRDFIISLLKMYLVVIYLVSTLIFHPFKQMLVEVFLYARQDLKQRQSSQ